MTILTRRGLLSVGALGGGLILSGCDKLLSSPAIVNTVQSAETATYRWQRLIGRNALARAVSAAVGTS